MLQSYVRGIPRDLEEAATVDGATPAPDPDRPIIAPLLAPGIVVTTPLRVHHRLERVLLRARPPPDPRPDDAAAAAGAVRRDRGHRPARPAGREPRCSRPSRASSSSCSSSAGSPAACSPGRSRASHGRPSNPASSDGANDRERRVTMRKLLVPRRPGARCAPRSRPRRRRPASQAERRQPHVRDLRLAADDGRGDEQAIVDSLEQGPPGDPGLDRPGRRQLRARQAADDFVGGTAADIIHDEAADIAGFTQQGYLANLTPLIPKDLKASIPKSLWDTRQLRRKITGVPSLLQTYNVFANMDILKAAGHQGADARESVDVGPVPRRREEAHDERQLRRLLGPPLADRDDPDDVAQLGRPVELPRERQVGAQGRRRASRTSLKTMHDMIHVDKSVDPAGVGLSGCAVLPAFFGGKCAMTVPGQLPGAGHDPAGPEGLQLGDVPAAQGRRRRTRRRTRRRSRSRSRASTRQRRCSSSPTRSTRRTWPSSRRATG